MEEKPKLGQDWQVEWMKMNTIDESNLAWCGKSACTGNNVFRSTGAQKKVRVTGIEEEVVRLHGQHLAIDLHVDHVGCSFRRDPMTRDGVVRLSAAVVRLLAAPTSTSRSRPRPVVARRSLFFFFHRSKNQQKPPIRFPVRANHVSSRLW